MKSKQLKLVAAGMGASAVVAMGAFTAFGDTNTGEAIIGDGPEITLGETTTSTTAPTELATTFVVPEVTAERPDGFEPG